jgi:hypothetical protein
MRVSFSILFGVLFCALSFAQVQEVKPESNKDMRHSTIIYKIDFKTIKESLIVERLNHNYQLTFIKNGQQQSIKKIEREVAERLDAELTVEFLELQLLNNFKMDCDYLMHLTFRGDEACLCPHNESKTNQLKSIWERHKELLK